ncbi:hypothetical protein BS47DRAFT_109419 [Hydnum rufescens UP504]|uniref:Transcription factor domain-containing protein n=1 Tax=Hydnum rufescens UP504 TaxID=1448309 RepID=A0A9P6AQT8_9AGAM|nr:hypothetical protein BS47DRAFT_109419 [Hydnum rufescens UP504]
MREFEARPSMSGVAKCVKCASKPSHDEPVLAQPLLQSTDYTSERASLRIIQMATIEPGQTLMSQSFPQTPALSSDSTEDVTKHLDDPEVHRMIAEQYAPPALILRGIVSPEEVRHLFAIFFERLNPHIEVLRQDIHTIPTLLARCPLLFTVICTLASRYLVSRPDLYPIAFSLAEEAISAVCFSDDAGGTVHKSPLIRASHLHYSVFGHHPQLNKITPAYLGTNDGYGQVFRCGWQKNWLRI